MHHTLSISYLVFSNLTALCKIDSFSVLVGKDDLE